MFNVSDATPLANVAANVNAIQDACVKVTTEVRPTRSQSSGGLHGRRADSMSYRGALPCINKC